MLATYKTHSSNVGSVLMLSAWGFTMVIASFLFLYVGHLIDGIFGTNPSFMLGFLLLSCFLCIMRLYQEACAKRKDV